MGRRRRPVHEASASVRHRSYMHIYRKIADGELEAGSAISELELARELGSSRTPIREAISQLTAEGLLEQTRNGVFVVQFTREDVIDLCELREALETYALTKVARFGLRREDRDRLERLVEAVLVLKEELESSGQAALNVEQTHRLNAIDFNFHALLIGLSQNVRIHKAVSETRLLMRVFLMRRRGHSASDLERIYLQHKELMDSIERQDGAATVRAISRHLQDSQQERLAEFDQHQRERSMTNCLPAALLEMYQPPVP